MRDGSVHILFANEHELLSLYQTADFDTALHALRAEKLLAVITRSEKGCVVIQGDTSVAVAAFPVQSVIDTTGAGDLFAAGFLAGLTKDKDLATCAKLGAMAAAEIIQHIGARPQTDLAQLAADHGLVL
jgi:adenosine kinase